MPSARVQRILLALMILVACGLAVASSGQTAPGDAKQPPEWRKPLDPEALRSMSKEERRAAVLKRRAEWDAAARARGIEQGPAGYKPLAEPIALPKRATRVPGTSIQYDSGVVTGFITLADSSRAAINRFDSALNASGTDIEPVQASGSLTMITFHLLRTSFNLAAWSLYSNAMGTTANFLTDVTVAVDTGLNTINVGDFGTTNNTYMGSSFLAGVFQLNTMYTRLGVDTNSTAGQGFHAYSINDVVGTLLNPLGDNNFVFRVGGNVAAPVELMSFEIE
ncbi:MAG: hypothetical protein AAF560_14775 [Acidobacteriota bacterium]